MNQYYTSQLQEPESEPSIESAIETPEKAQTFYRKLSALGFFVFAAYGMFSLVMDVVEVVQ
jgi:hypothetical protein